MSLDNTPNTTKICPTCGTRLNPNATRCSVCGSVVAPGSAASSAKAVKVPRMPEVTLSLPLMVGLAVLLLIIGAGIVYAVLQSMNGGEAIAGAEAKAETATPTLTATITMTPTEESTPTLEPTWTLEPPVTYKVAAGDDCLTLAYVFGVDVRAITTLNNLGSECFITEGMELLIPKPTPTASPQPTSTPNPTQLAEAACEKVEYIVKEGETIGGIAANYAVTIEDIRAYNAKSSEVVYVGEKLLIPLCKQQQQLETPTPTAVPNYGAANLLLPADGESFTNPAEVITLQWASVGTLRQNEAYAVTIEDVTEGSARRLVEYVTDTKFIIPETFRPQSDKPHIFRWSVLPVRQTGTDKKTGDPIWEPAGDVSVQRVFSWVGVGSGPVAPTDTPQPTETSAGP